MILDQGTYKEIVERDWNRAEELGIDAIPTFVIGQNKLVGAQEYRSLSRFVDQNSVPKR